MSDRVIVVRSVDRAVVRGEGRTGPPGPPGTIVAVGPLPPADPQVDDLWVDTS